jgi:uncharacterized protein (DUF302 family)
MIEDLQVRHYEYSTARSFEDVVAAFEAAVGTIEDTGWESIRAGARNVAEFEARVRERIGDSGFTRFLTIDHGSWLTLMGQPTKMRMYTIGNPLIAITMLRHNIAAGLNVPVRLAIYRDEVTGATRLVYDQPSTLMSGLHDANLAAAAQRLDAKLVALAERVMGAKAD